MTYSNNKPDTQMKQTIYFPHDFNASTDPKMLKLRAKQGYEGCGIFWAILEQLRAATDCMYLKSDIDCLALSLGLTEQKVSDIIAICIDLNLFSHNKNYFWSDRMIRDYDYMTTKSKKAKESIERRWEKQRSEDQEDTNNSNTNVIRTYEKRIKENEKNDTNVIQREDIKEINEIKETKENNPNPLKGAISSQTTPEKIVAGKKTLRGVLARMDEYMVWLDNLAIPEGQARDLILEWLEDKAMRRQYYSSQKSLNTLIERLREMSGGSFENAKLIVKTAIANTSQGLYPVKAKANGKHEPSHADHVESVIRIAEQVVRNAANNDS